MRLQEQLLRKASSASAFVCEHLARHGDWRLADYLRSLRSGPDAPLQPRDALWDAVAEEAGLHYGRETAALAVEELAADPIAPTSNHFGLDTLADSVQGTLLFGLRRPPGRPRKRTLVVLGFGSISLNNLTYPMGLLLYDTRRGAVGELPQRVPVLPNRLKHCAVSAAPPFDAAMVDRARARLHEFRRTGELTTFCAGAADAALGEAVASPGILALPTYRHQASQVNAALWRRMFGNPEEAPQLVHLEIEAVCARVLRTDLFERESLTHQLLFDPTIRNTLLSELDGARACWRRDRLLHRLRSGRSHHGPGGTLFFWGLSKGGRRIPLTFEGDGSSLALAGLDETGGRHSWEWTPLRIAEALDAGELLPSLFTCFSVISFAHGLSCVGGYYQIAYLPRIQRGICRALSSVRGTERAVRRVSEVPTEVFLAGLQGIVRELDDGALLPAGPLEISAGGKLTRADLVALESVSVREASLAAFTELFEHVAPDASLPRGWIGDLAAENGASCRGLVRITGAR